MKGSELHKFINFLAKIIIPICIGCPFINIEASNSYQKQKRIQEPKRTASSYFVHYAKKSQNQPAHEGKTGTGKVTINVNFHVNGPLAPNTLFLRHAEVKLFSGHLLNFLRAKCPKVDPLKIKQLQTYISSRTPEAIHYASEKKTAFNQLLSSLRFCSTSFNSHNAFKLPGFADRFMIKIQEIIDVKSITKLFQELSPDSEKAYFWVWLTKLKDDLNNIIPLSKDWNFWNKKRNQNDNEFRNLPKKLATENTETENESTFHFVRDKETSKWKLKKSKSKPESGTSKMGEVQLQEFLEYLLKLYSEHCISGSGNSRNLQIFFKAASNDLFNYFSIDSNRANLAAAKYLTQDFQQSVRECTWV